MPKRSPKVSKNKSLIKVLLGIAVTIAAVYFTVYALEGINIREVLKSDINWVLVAFSGVIFVLSTLVRAMAYTLGIEKDLTAIEAWQIVAIGNAANMVLPLRAGEALRFVVFPKRYKAAEKAKLLLIPGMFDIAFLLLISAATVYIAEFKQEWYLITLKIASYGFLAFLAVLFILLLIIPKTRSKLFSYCNSDTLKMIKWIGLSWAIMLISVLIAFVSMGYTTSDSFVLSFGSMGGLNIIGLIPSSPGNIGIFEYSVTLGLMNNGIDELKAKTAGLVLHFIQYASLIPLGIILCLRYFFVEKRKRVICTFGINKK